MANPASVGRKQLLSPLSGCLSGVLYRGVQVQIMNANHLCGKCTFLPRMNEAIFTKRSFIGTRGKFRLPSEHWRSANNHRNRDFSCLRFRRNSSSLLSLGRYFHTSEPRKAAPLLPAIGAVLARFAGPIANFLKLLAILAGRTFRKWWKKLPGHKREKLREQLLSRKDVIAAILSTFVGAWLLLYYIHLEETPYTKRLRYVGVTPHQMRDLAESQWRKLLESYADDIVPVDHQDHKRVFRVAERLVRANADKMMENIQWEVNVIASDDINAFVLPNGQIFVFTGLLRFLTDDDALAVIVGHEIAHAILQHSAEQLCFHGFVNLLKVVLLATIWALLPNDVLAFLTQSIQNAILGGKTNALSPVAIGDHEQWPHGTFHGKKILAILMKEAAQLFWHLPYSRALEEEADRVGLYFAAKGCFDVRQGPIVWQQFGALEKIQDTPSVEWLSTHPSHENRERNLEGIVPEALALRRMCKCPELSGVPPIQEKVKPLTLASLSGIYNEM